MDKSEEVKVQQANIQEVLPKSFDDILKENGYTAEDILAIRQLEDSGFIDRELLVKYIDLFRSLIQTNIVNTLNAVAGKLNDIGKFNGNAEDLKKMFDEYEKAKQVLDGYIGKLEQHKSEIEKSMTDIWGEMNDKAMNKNRQDYAKILFNNQTVELLAEKIASVNNKRLEEIERKLTIHSLGIYKSIVLFMLGGMFVLVMI